MKIVKGSSVSALSLMILLLINFISTLYLLGKDLSLTLIASSYIFINVIGFLIILPRNYYFTYDTTFFFVKNTLNPFYEKKYLMKDIVNIERKIESFVGKAIIIEDCIEGKTTFSTDISNEDLNEMIEDIEKLKENQS